MALASQTCTLLRLAVLLKPLRGDNVTAQALTSLGCMEHRGACSADADSGDGAGIMTQIPWKLLKEDIPELNEKTTG